MSSATLSPSPNRRQDNTPSSSSRSSLADPRALSTAELARITSYSSELRLPLKSLENLQRRNADLRDVISDLSNRPPAGFMTRCVSFVTSFFGARNAVAITRQTLERELATNIKQIKIFTETVIQPKVDAIRRKFEGKTFVRTEDTPRPLVLAGVPTEKVGKIPSHATLISSIVAHVKKLDTSSVKVTSIHEDESIQITRLNKRHEQETLRISYRRPGKVDVEIVGPNGVQKGNLWNDDAQKLADAFSAGLNLSMRPTKFKHYTIV